MSGGRWVDRLTLGPARRRRWMRRRLAQLDRLDGLDGASGSSGARHGRGSGAGLHPVAAAALLVVLLGAGGSAYLASGLADGLPLGGDERLRAAPPDPGGSGGYAFAATQPGRPEQPVTYSPCEVVQVEENDAAAPPGTEGMVADAVAEISRLTGLEVVLTGTTDDLPRADGRRALDEPVLVAWTDPDQVPALEGDVAGLGGSTRVVEPMRQRAWYRTGEVALDSPDLDRMLQGPRGADQAYAVVLHELGHVVGLAHVDDRTQLMHAENSGVLAFQDGDVRGLARLGGGRCR